MSTRMLIDARHPEETRVTVVKGSRVEEFDYESASKRPLKGNIYLARITRVEPSLQAAFVEYGGNRHGFLAFSEIHPDYYQIPVEDRQALIEAETKAAMERAQELDAKIEKEAEEAEKKQKSRRRRRPKQDQSRAEEATETAVETSADGENGEDAPDDQTPAVEGKDADTTDESDLVDADAVDADADDDADGKESDEAEKDAEIAEAAARRQALKALKRKYSIQEVIKRRQVLLVQVVKEERGNKGAALTTYMSLAGRYCVLMPNSTHSGGISRKISNASDRRSLKKIISSLEVPDEMGLIVRTAGMERTKTEIKRDYDYLSRLWSGIRDLTLQSVAPALIYEEGNLIKRTIRDLYTRDIDEIQVEGEAGYRAAKDFMKLLMPSHAKKVQHYQDPIPLFHRYQVESHLEAMYQPVVQLKSGGYIVINPTEALISIDVNSGRSTKEHNIEETALKTNLEAAEEVARQLRLRDMAGLVVIDFIDMEERSNNRSVERRMKDVLKSDRARIQVGRISSFGLMEMSRQRLRSNLLEVSMETCVACAGSGIVRSTESAALMALRLLEEEGIRGRSSLVRIAVCPDVAVYLLNKKRKILAGFETQYDFEIEVLSQSSMGPSDIEVTREAASETASADKSQTVKPDTEASDMPTSGPTETVQADDDSERQPRKRRRRRRRRRGGADQPEQSMQNEQSTAANENETGDVKAADETTEGRDDHSDEERKPRRRRGSRGGRKRHERNSASGDAVAVSDGPDEAAVEPTSDDTAPTGEASEEKPRRRRRRARRSDAPEQTTEEETASTEASASTPEDAKPRRSRRRKADDPAVAADDTSGAASDSSEEPEAKVAKPRRRRKKAEEPGSDEASQEAAETAAKKPRTRRKKPEAADKSEAGPADTKPAESEPEKKPARSRRKPAKADTPEDKGAKADTTKPSGPKPDTPTDDNQPKRQGWWQRTFG